MAEAKNHDLPVKRLLAIFAVVSVVPLALLTFLSIRLAHDAVASDARARVLAYAQQTVSTIDSQMSGVSALLSSYAQRPVLREAMADPRHLDRAEIHRQLRELDATRAGKLTLLMLRPDGRVIAAEPEGTTFAHETYGSRAWFRQAVRSGKPLISRAYRESARGRPNVLAQAAPLRDRSGHAVGVLISISRLDGLQAYVDYFASSLGVQLTLTDQRGSLLAGPAHDPRQTVSLAKDPLVAAALHGKSGVATDNRGKRPSMAAYAPIPSLGWAVIAGLPDAAVFARVDRLRSTVYTVAGILALVLLGVLLLLARTLRRQQRAEAEAAVSRAAAEEARRTAEQASRAKSEFLSRMSHELRTPLNAVLGFGQLLEMDELSQDQEESVQQILKAGEHLLTLINEVLDISRIEAGGISLSLEPVALEELVNETVDLVRPIAERDLITIEADLAGDVPHAYADRQRLKQVLLNLLSNAVKFNRTGGSVRISLRSDRQRLRLEIADTGDGIPPEKLAQLFQPFERLGADQKQIEGTGLGLVLSKGLVEAMGGQIGASSDSGGSTFWLDLATAQAPIDSATDEFGDLLAAEPTDSPAATVLYIEDNVSNLRLITRVLEQRRETKLISAMQGSLGLELAGLHSPDLILLDLHLPDMPGDEVLAQLRHHPNTAHIPIVVLSADASPGRLERLLQQGATDYLAKPINVRHLLQILDTYTNEPAPPTDGHSPSLNVA